ncbi:hypothetical protein DM01DRAFT_1369544 [Hesseltinella vesiculosa]|uniref:DNA mismatch repair proteins mutS family domain-containing protein n=1 Tax=Hesseltinella vesiculosa TaxID=101127 RepID=A0A1X2GY15_9FUNG|nr:hypothetical protein DM01DRAFT_1369544 [Hesseltinella vesiculosa]
MTLSFLTPFVPLVSDMCKNACNLDSDIDPSIEIVVSVPKLFKSDAGKNALVHWHMDERMPAPTDSDLDSDQQTACMYQEALLQLSVILSCVCPLFDYIKEHPTSMHVLSVETIDLHNAMRVSEEDLYSLQILDRPSSFQSDVTTPSSLFAVLNNTVTSSGQVLLKEWFHRPSLEIQVIEGRLRSIKLLHRLPNSVLQELSRLLKHIKNIPRILGRIGFHRASVQDWLDLYHFVYYCLMIIDMLNSNVGVPPNNTVLQKILGCPEVQASLAPMMEMIQTTIDFSKSSEFSHVVVLPGVDPELDQLQYQYDHLEDELLTLADCAGKHVPPEVAPFVQMVYVPRMGFFMALPDTVAGLMEEVDYNDEFGVTREYTNDHVVYYRCPMTDYFGQRYGDIHTKVEEKHIELVQNLGDQVLLERGHLLVLAEYLTELDCIQSLAKAALDHHYNPPTVTTARGLSIQFGRHPIYELVFENYVANSASSIPPIMVLTGANASGKSAYMKQIALIVYMAHIGSFVPAKEALVGLTDKIFTCTSTVESSMTNTSAFAHDALQVAQAIEYATDRSLVVMDEFGKGTIPEDGTSLLAASLNYFAQKHPNCPTVIASTHFHDLLVGNLVWDSYPFGLYCMSTKLNQKGTDLEYHYQVQRGLDDRSFAFTTAVAAGLSVDDVQQAESYEQRSRYETMEQAMLHLTFSNDDDLATSPIYQALLAPFSYLLSLDDETTPSKQ